MLFYLFLFGKLNEILGTSLKLPGKSAKDIGMQQSYILAIGPALDATKLGFKVGDRVLLQGSYNPVPKLQGDEENGREKGLIEAHAIRGVLQEASAIVVE